MTLGTILALSFGSALLLADPAQGGRPMQGALRAGDPAPNFKLKTLDGKGEFELNSNFGKKPTVLIFGSYT
jgi:hypothetical protein